MQNNSSSENGTTSSKTNSSPQFICACHNKILKSGSSLVVHQKKARQSQSAGAPWTESGQSVVPRAATELTHNVPPLNDNENIENANLACTNDDLGLELKLGSGAEARKSKPCRKKGCRHHPYAKGWLPIPISGRSGKPGSEKSFERTTSDPNGNGENGVEVCSSKANAIDLGLELGVKGYEVDLELRLNSWI